MRIKQMINQHRRDFTALYECESCGHTKKRSGYDDRNFHDNVIPSIQCDNCGKSRNDLRIQSDITETKYPDGMNV